MPQRPRAHISGVLAERDHWLRSRETLIFLTSLSHNVSGFIRDSRKASKIELLSIREFGESNPFKIHVSIEIIAYLEFLIFHLSCI